MKQIFLVLVIILTLPVYGEGSGIYSQAVVATQQLQQKVDIELAWEAGFRIASNKAEDQKLEDIHHYLKLSEKQKTAVAKRIPKIPILIQLTEPEKLLNLIKATSDLTTEMHKKIKADPDILKELIRDYHRGNQQIDSDLLDTLIGINYEETEKKVKDIGYLDNIGAGWRKFTTQTYYEEIKEMFQHHPPRAEDVVYDLGSGYGRVLFYGAALFPTTKFKGIEIVPERVAATKTIADQKKYTNVTFINQDILKSDFQDGSYFYLFNPFPNIMNQVLAKLQIIAAKRKIIILATGRSVEDLEKVPWLKQIKIYKTKRLLTAYESRFSK